MRPSYCYAIILTLVLALSTLADPPQVTKIEAKRDRGFDYLDIYATGQIKVQGLLLEDTLVLEFPEATIAQNVELSKKPSRRIANITANNSQVIITLKNKIDYDIVNVFGYNKSVVEISDRLDRAEKIMLAWEEANLKQTSLALKPYELTPPASASQQPLWGKTIVLDPGHGGEDPGAAAQGGTFEKHLTLATAQHTAKLLQAAGATVYLTRNEDRRSSLKDIVNFTNKIKPDILVSLHYNYSHKRDVSGIETYYYNNDSRSLAKVMHWMLLNGLARKDHGLRRAKFYVVNHSKVPAILLEPLYLSNAKEAQLAASPAFQQQIASNIVRGVKAYFRSKSR